MSTHLVSQIKESKMRCMLVPVPTACQHLNVGGIAEKHPEILVDRAEVAAGTKVEMEHTDDKSKARAIAVDHVVEIPDYYKRLEVLEAKADQEGVKRADKLLHQLVSMPDRHQREVEEHVGGANKSLQNKRIFAELAAGVGALPSYVPGMQFVLPSYDELREKAHNAVHAQAQQHAEDLAALQAGHADEMVDLHSKLRAREAKQAVAPMYTEMAATPRGDELHTPMDQNPFDPSISGDPKLSNDYENGYSYAQALGLSKLNVATEGDVTRWQGAAKAWRAGFADACERFGLNRVGDIVRPEDVKAAMALPSGLVPSGHLTRGLFATAGGLGAGLATQALWGDTGQTYTLVPPALAGVAGGTILGDVVHSGLQRASMRDGRLPEEGSTGDDPRVRLPQGLAALGGGLLGAGAGVALGHYGVPDSWHATSGGHVPEIVGASVGGLGGAIGGSLLESRLSGREKDAEYTVVAQPAQTPKEVPMSIEYVAMDTEAKTANIMPILGALGGAGAGYALAPHVPQIGEFVQGHQLPGSVQFQNEAPNTEGAVLRYSDSNAPGIDAAVHTHNLAADKALAQNARYYGAGLGGAAGLGVGALLSRDPNKTATVIESCDADLSPHATEILTKEAALGSTLGTIAGIGGGALAGNYLVPALHWAGTPGTGAATDYAVHEDISKQLAQIPQDGGQHPIMVDQGRNDAIRAGAQAAQGAQWQGLQHVGQIAGAGIGGITGYNVGRAVDEAAGLEKKEKPIVISPWGSPQSAASAFTSA